MIKIAVAEDNRFSLMALLEKLKSIEGFTLAFTARNGQELLDGLKNHADLNLVLMDIEMPVIDGIQATEIAKQWYPQLKIVMITIYDDDQYIFNAIKAGADSYILKETKADKLQETLLDTMNGGSVMSPSIAMKTLNLLKKSPDSLLPTDSEKISLSEREQEILIQISTGRTNQKIAESLFISPFTVKRHIENIYQKLQAHNRIEVIEKARKSGLL